MFSKLLKYEIKNTKKLALPLILVVLLAGVFFSVFMFIEVHNITRPTDAPMHESMASDIITTIFMLLMVLAIAVSCLTLFIILAKRYNDSMIKDEAYLTFTLPASTDKILLSKVVNAIIWLAVLIVALIVVLSMSCFSIGIAETIGRSDPDINTFEHIKYAFEDMWTMLVMIAGCSYSDRYLYSVLCCISFILKVICAVAICYSSITFVGMRVKKHKLLVGILLVYAVFAVGYMLMSIVDITFLCRNSPDVEDYFRMEVIINSVSFAYYLIMGVAAYLFTGYNLKNKLNIE